MRVRRTVILISFGVVGVVALLIGATYALVGDPLDPFDNRSFSPSAWKAAGRESRARMSRGATRRVTAGTGEPQVVALLGQPDWIYNAGEHEHMFGVRCYVYEIGNWSFHGMDAAFVYVHLDQNERVVTAEIYGY